MEASTNTTANRKVYLNLGTSLELGGLNWENWEELGTGRTQAAIKLERAVVTEVEGTNIESDPNLSLRVIPILVFTIDPDPDLTPIPKDESDFILILESDLNYLSTESDPDPDPGFHH